MRERRSKPPGSPLTDRGPAHAMPHPNCVEPGDGHRVRAWSVLAVVSCAVTIAACGSSSEPSTIGSASAGQAIAYTDCMRSHGVTGFPDPSPEGGVALPSSINPQSPSYQAALQDCARLQPGPAGGPPKASERQRTAGLSFSKCMRRHGLPDFPDPVISSRPPNQDEGVWRAGMYWPLPPGTQQSPAFLKAGAACGLR
jgi:hypothetical protein